MRKRQSILISKEAMRTQFYIRLTFGLAISCLVVYRLATAEIVWRQCAPTSPIFPFSALYAESGNTLRHQDALPASFQPPLHTGWREPDPLSRAFAASTADLLGVRAVPLASYGDETLANISLAASAVDLTAVHPNEIFSFNRVVGMRRAERGYQPGLMYSDGDLILGIGGGVCVVSTALYNLALETGLKIIERHPHSGPVSYAPPGRDSAVSSYWVDLCFKNNTGGMLLIRATVRNDKLVVAFYGKTKPGQTVEIVSRDYEELLYKIVEKEDETVPEGEVVVEQKARPGFSVTTIRLIRWNGRLVSREIISRDIIAPRDKVILVHPESEELVPSTSSGHGLEPLPGMPDATKELLPLPPVAPGSEAADEGPLPAPKPPGAEEQIPPAPSSGGSQP